MIIEKTILGDGSTSKHNFTFETVGMQFMISPGVYEQCNQIKFISEGDTFIDVPQAVDDTQYQIWATNQGFMLISKPTGSDFDSSIEPIDCIAWFTIPGNCTSLTDVEINVLKIIE